MDLNVDEVCGVQFIQSTNDTVMLSDPTVLRRFLEIEAESVVNLNYFDTLQIEITPKMRITCLSWIIDVAEEQRCDDAVVPLAANIMDRVLSKVPISRGKFQLLGSVCLMIASKLRQNRHLSSALLSAYTADTYTAREIVDFELDVLTLMKWSLSSVTPYDFLTVFLFRLPDFDSIRSTVQYHTKTFLQMCIFDFDFSSWPPSLTAIASMAVTIKGFLSIENEWPHVGRMYQIFNEITDIQVEIISNCTDYMEDYVNKWINTARVALRVEAELSIAGLVDKVDGTYPDDDEDN